MYRSAVYERSPYLVVEGDPACGCWSWATVLDALSRTPDAAASAPAALPADVRRDGAGLGLAVGLAFRQLALLYEDVRYAGWPLRMAA
jgi:hypothetical protein